MTEFYEDGYDGVIPRAEYDALIAQVEVNKVQAGKLALEAHRLNAEAYAMPWWKYFQMNRAFERSEALSLAALRLHDANVVLLLRARGY